MGVPENGNNLENVFHSCLLEGRVVCVCMHAFKEAQKYISFSLVEESKAKGEAKQCLLAPLSLYTWSESATVHTEISCWKMRIYVFGF